MPPISRRAAILAVFCGFAAFALGTILSEPTLRVVFTPTFMTEWLRVGKVMRMANACFVDADKAGLEKVGRNAAIGAASSLDRYSEFLDKDAFAEQNRRSEQLFTGIGILMQPVDGLIAIERVYEGGGASAAGLLVGDRIVGADGHNLAGLPTDEASSKIRGTEGTTVKLRILRPGEAAERTFTVARRTVTVPTVTTFRMLDDGVTAHVVVDHFERKTPAEISSAVEELKTKGARRLVLDLRGNPGGLVDAAADTVGLFTPKGSLVARLAGRAKEDSEDYRTLRAPTYPEMPLALLVDAHSASSSEIVAGALQDYKRAVLVGEKTYGKGIVQSIYKLDDTTGLKLTTARYTLPSGRTIHGTGVSPDVTVEESLDDSARRYTEDSLVKHAGGATAFSRRFGYTPGPDRALATAVALLAAAKK
jgi:carboxyl-terminal processing protease